MGKEIKMFTVYEVEADFIIFDSFEDLKKVYEEIKNNNEFYVYDDVEIKKVTQQMHNKILDNTIALSAKYNPNTE